MESAGLIQLALCLAVLLLCAHPLGVYMARVCAGHAPRAVRCLRPIERAVDRLCSVCETSEMGWRRYAFAMLLFNGMGFVAVHALQRVPASPTRYAERACTPRSIFRRSLRLPFC